MSAGWSVAARGLTLTVPHHGHADITYPVAVDPLFVGGDCPSLGIAPHVQDSYDYVGVDCHGQQAGAINTGQNGNAETFAQWHYLAGGTAMNHATSGYSYPSSYWGYGLFVWTQSGVNYGGFNYGEFVYQAPPGAFIQQVDFYRDEHQLAWSGSSQLYEGVYNATNQVWEPETAYDTYGSATTYLGANPYYIGGQRAYYQQDIKVGNGGNPFTSSARGTLGNMAVFGMLAAQGVRGSNVLDEVYMGGATVFLYDTGAPSLTSSGPASSSQWANDHNQTYTVNPSGYDNGLGMKYFNLAVANGNGVTGFQQAQNPCTGDHVGGYCPSSWSTSVQYQLPEGNDTISLQPFDALQNGGNTQSWTAKIDRTPPPPPTFNGVADGTTLQGGQTVTINDPDPPASGADGSSGPASVSVSLDGGPSTSQPCAGSCTYQVPQNISAGNHTLAATPTDGAGNVGQAGTLAFTVAYSLPEGAPQVSTTRDNSGSLTVSWQPAPATPTSTVTSDTVTLFACGHSGTDYLQQASVAEHGSGSDQYSWQGLDPDQCYSATVTPTNPAGNGPSGQALASTYSGPPAVTAALSGLSVAGTISYPASPVTDGTSADGGDGTAPTVMSYTVYLYANDDSWPNGTLLSCQTVAASGTSDVQYSFDAGHGTSACGGGGAPYVPIAGQSYTVEAVPLNGAGVSATDWGSMTVEPAGSGDAGLAYTSETDDPGTDPTTGGCSAWPSAGDINEPDGGVLHQFTAPDGTVGSSGIAPAGFDPIAATADQLAMYGYPDRPATSDPAYAAWKTLVTGLSFVPASPCSSASITQVPPTYADGTSNLDSQTPDYSSNATVYTAADEPSASGASVRSGGSVPSNIFSGITGRGRAGYFRKANGYFTEPALRKSCSGSALVDWVGLGGGPNGLIQDGTAINPGKHAYAWFEWLSPVSGHTIALTAFTRVGQPNIPIRHADQIEAVTSYDPSSQMVSFIVVDVTRRDRGQSPNAVSYRHRLSTDHYDGSQVQFIDERPSAPKPVPLANFGQVSWQYAGATDSGGRVTPVGKRVYNYVYMTSDGKSSSPRLAAPGHLRSPQSYTDRYYRCS